MKLVGTYVSHFVRRVAIPLKIYGINYDAIDASVTTDQAIIKQHSKLARIPSLVLDDGDVLIDSDYILAEIDSMVPENERLTVQNKSNRRHYGQVLAALTGAMDKATAWFYEAHRRPKEFVWDEWAEHLRTQLAGGVLQVEENPHIFANNSEYLFEDRLTHADIAAGLVYPLANMAAADLVNAESCPRLAKLALHMNSLDAFQTTSPS